MLFYKFQGIVTTEQPDESDRRARREYARTVMIKSERFNEKYAKGSYYFISSEFDGIVDGGVITERSKNLEETIEKYLTTVGMPLKDIEITEITLNNINSMLETSRRQSYIEDEDEVLEKFDLDRLLSRNSIEFGENIITKLEKDEIVDATNKYLMSETLLPEIERIYEGKACSGVSGHPVHYMLQTDSPEIRRETYKILLSALYDNGRLSSRRYTFWNVRPGESFSLMSYDTLYRTCNGGTIIVRYLSNDDVTDTDRAFGDNDTIEDLCEAAKRYRNKVLTIFCLPRESTKARSLFFENLGSMSLVELKEDLISGEKTIAFLKEIAKKNHIRADKQLFAKLDDNKEYHASELQTVFEEWYNNKLKSVVYPQYKSICTVEHQSMKAKPKGSAYDELDAMIGLSQAKEVIHKALNYYKMQKLYKERGIKSERPAMHMIFSGNPGTAKTTVARLFARIMRENGLLSSGHLVEVGRGDLVGKYVGWTAQTVQEKFKAARGGVLFIDEAYSLADEGRGSFGDEAINTIVQEMENNRDNMVVIFAGYPDKMKGFLQKNPGLSSRIAFHVSFDDYSTDELCRIAKLIGKNNGMRLSDKAMDKLGEIFDVARKDSDFGNGRYVRNVFEQARLNQASRLMKGDIDAISDEDISTITHEDIIIPERKNAEKTKIGF